jgi:hypothetical protein
MCDTVFHFNRIIMPIRYFFICLIVIVGMTSCEKTIDNFEVQDKEPKLVVHGVAISDSSLRINLTKSLSFNDVQRIEHIGDATVKLSDSQEELGILSYEGRGWYGNNELIMEPGINYQLNLSAPGYNEARTTFTIPQKPVVENIEANIVTEHDPNCIGCDPYKQLVLDITFDDLSTEENFYILEMYHRSRNYTYTDYSVYPDDTTEYEARLNLTTASRIIEVERDYAYFWNVSPDYDAYGKVLIFSDKLINGDRYTLTVKAELNEFIYSDLPDEYFVADLRFSQTNSTYYEYAKNMADVNESEDNFLAEPVTVYQSVINGFGLVYGRNIYHYSIDLLQIDPDLRYEYEEEY